MAALPSFDNEMVLRFIRSYRENQCLWDFSSPAYKNKAARDEAYERLVADIDVAGLTVNDVKNKIKNIRSTYCQELKKIQTAKLLGREPYVPSVFWFRDLDSFLHANTTPRADLADRKVPKYLTKFHNLPPQTMHTDFYYQQCQSAEETNNSFPEPADGELPLLIQQEYGISEAEDPINNSVASEPSAKKVKYDMDNSDLANLVKETVQQLKHITSTVVTNSEDEFEVFGRSVAIQLKKMSLCTALTVQSKIQDLLSQYRIKDINKTEFKNVVTDSDKRFAFVDVNREGNKCLKDTIEKPSEEKESAGLQPTPISPQHSPNCLSEHSDSEMVQ